MNAIGIDELRGLAMLPPTASGHSPFAEPCLLLRLGGTAERRLADWLRQLPCPVIGIGEADAPLAASCDVVVQNEQEAQPLLAGVRRSPVAATVLVQLLRASESLPVADALTMESLAYATLQGGAEFRRWLEGRPAPPVPPAETGPAVLLAREADTLRLTLNRPARRNSMSVEMRDALVEALQLALADDDIRRVRIDGAGKCFSTGGELDEFGTAPDPATAHAVRSLTVPGRLLAACADRAEARVHGACIGSGIEFPAFAGRIVAAPDAWFQLPELQFGLIPGAGGCVSLPRRIGRQRTACMVLGGKRIDARTAKDWGLVDAIESSR
ncbi:enoyl-CoA hydratase/isomerase family protein [Solimonas sp. K1W22B-7]|uniref:enoyl-CoA hydratase/isomerase family protein n=1 Tax=Solimonas sp. K1W22B-7 TaxID=2303331 RepID=UPI000E32F7BA|nr:enoyl-CoA hydratase/isomerase family protein [Solimonas sp. K1W22B-7]AXQ30194.1 enoyl-CoA hydratase/isomerase family protein [Solimonas sp. K1W22B-7]